MATQTGTFLTNTDLMIKLNAFLTTNGWTKLRGETDQANASPKAARYWRVLVLETEDTTADFRELELMEWRATTGGANVALTGTNYSFSSLASGTGADLVSGTGTVQSADIDDNMWWVQYDFGAPQIIHEITMMCDTDNYAPSRFYVQWSNDALVWTTMYETEGLAWVDNETKTFTWDTGAGYTNPRHPSATVSRRSGYSDIQSGGSFSKYNEYCDNLWTWQGPGFDAARRVYISALTWTDPVAGDDHTAFVPHTEYDAAVATSAWLDTQVGVPNDDGKGKSYLVSDASGGTYWFYVNSQRFIVVVKSGIADYTSAYCGFMSQFALPDDYPFPLYVGATTDSITEGLTSANADVRDFVDPGNGSKAMYRASDGLWRSVTNHDGQTTVNDPTPIPASWNAPYHTGDQNRNNWPDNTIGDYTGWDAHWLDRIDPTVQGDLPFMPVIVTHYVDGHIGALDGVFAVPRGSVLSPEQVITIAAVNYRVFSTRTKVGGMNYYAIIET